MNTSSAKPRASVDSELMTRVDCLHRLVSTIPVSAMSVACGGLLIAYWLYDLAPHGLLSGWLALILCMAGLRLGYLLWFRRCFDGSNVSGWEGRYAVLTGLTGLSWGALPWMPLADPNHNLLFIIVVLLFCILLATASQLVASIPALFCASVCLLTPMLARVTSLDPKLALLFTLGTVVVTTVVLLAVKEQRQMLLGALRDRHEIDELLRQQKVIFESAGEGIVFLRPRPEYVVSWNRRFAEMLGHADEVLKGMEPWRWHPAREQWKRLVIDAHPYLVAGQPYHAKMELIRADGSVFWGEITGMAVAGENLSAGTVWVISDITDQRAAESALRASENRFRDLVKLSSDLYWEQDEKFRFTHFDGPSEITQKLPLARVLGNTRWEAADIFGVHESRWKHHIEMLQRHEPFRDFIYQINGVDGHRYWLSVNGNPLFDDHGHFAGYHGTASDITLRIEAEERFRHLAYHDTLTRLPNRRLLTDRLDQAIRTASRRGGRVALLLLDLDGFKQINDRHGHAAGDRVLEAIAGRLREAVREADTVARMGGDEFVVLLPEIAHIDDALRVADKIHESVREPIGDGRHLHTVGTSIGISIFPDHGESADALLHRADHAMYHGKSDGGKTTRMFDTSLLN